MTAADARVRPPAAAAERSLAPDLARGVMLLLIAVANVPWYLYGRPTTAHSIHAPGGSLADTIVQAVTLTVVDSRTYPMFAFLFGYGVVQLYQRQTGAGTTPDAARRLLRRRHWWLVAFGVLHCALLWVGDILATYGLVGLVLVGLFFRRRDRTLLTWSLVLLGISVLSMIGSIVGAIFAAQSTVAPAPSTEAPAPNPYDPFLAARTGIADPDYLTSILDRLAFLPVLVVIQGFVTLAIPVAFLLAMWSARHGILERPGEHRALLRRTAVIGIGVGWLGGLAVTLHHLGVTAVPERLSWVYSGVQSTTGLLCGIGYVALFGLLSDAYQRRRGRAGIGHGVRALTAVGKRSLSCYLAQSVLFAPLLSAWGWGWGGWLTSWSAAALAVAVWLLTIVLAAAQERAGQRGPAEVVLRRLAYGPAALRQPAPS